jgi:hypothetical protein
MRDRKASAAAIADFCKSTLILYLERKNVTAIEIRIIARNPTMDCLRMAFSRYAFTEGRTLT